MSWWFFGKRREEAVQDPTSADGKRELPPIIEQPPTKTGTVRIPTREIRFDSLREKVKGRKEHAFVEELHRLKTIFDVSEKASEHIDGERPADAIEVLRKAIKLPKVDSETGINVETLPEDMRAQYYLSAAKRQLMEGIVSASERHIPRDADPKVIMDALELCGMLPPRDRQDKLRMSSLSDAEWVTYTLGMVRESAENYRYMSRVILESKP
ncbi:MAG: hypothetical protein KKD39_07755 [Candidatus Altiarchaeota archaeon]|nr:hypothetical protein [Candidatus Altiarchaeota archaeon]